MTLADIEHIPREILTVAEIAPLLDADPHTIRLQAQRQPEKLGFPVIVTGARVKIPKEGFLFFWKYGRPIKEAGA